jgi:interferon gamma-inducible protein 30
MILDYFQQSKMPNGTWVFKCQHGESECQGNKEQACALSLFQNNASIQVQFISCVMSTRSPPRAGSQVIPVREHTGLQQFLDLLWLACKLECSTSSAGKKLLK